MTVPPILVPQAQEPSRQPPKVLDTGGAGSACGSGFSSMQDPGLRDHVSVTDTPFVVRAHPEIVKCMIYLQKCIVQPI